MIRAVFYYDKEDFCVGFSFSGHADFSSVGSDIVCAGVSSAVQMCCNGILEVLKVECDLSCTEGNLSLNLNSRDDGVQAFLEALRLHICTLEKDYSENIYVSIVEV